MVNALDLHIMGKPVVLVTSKVRRWPFGFARET
jgi:hypothetical protein